MNRNHIVYTIDYGCLASVCSPRVHLKRKLVLSFILLVEV